MGFFSFRCAVSGKPILASKRVWPEDLQALSDVVLVLPNGTVRGTYDGYGRLEDRRYDGEASAADVPERLVEDVKLVLASEYSGQAFDSLPVSENEPNQGAFWSAGQIRDVVAGLFPYPQPFKEQQKDPLDALRHTEWHKRLGRVLGPGEDRDFVGQMEELRSDLAQADERAIQSGRLPREDAVCIALRRVGYDIEGDAQDTGVDLDERRSTPRP